MHGLFIQLELSFRLIQVNWVGVAVYYWQDRRLFAVGRELGKKNNCKRILIRWACCFCFVLYTDLFSGLGDYCRYRNAHFLAKKIYICILIKIWYSWEEWTKKALNLRKLWFFSFTAFNHFSVSWRRPFSIFQFKWWMAREDAFCVQIKEWWDFVSQLDTRKRLTDDPRQKSSLREILPVWQMVKVLQKWNWILILF